MTVVLLHGFGAPGDDLAGLANALAVPAGTTLVFPEALHDLGELAGPLYAGARAWWLIDFAKLEVAINTGAIEDLPNEIPEGLSEARASIVDFLDALEKQEGISLDRLVLGGFSQGAMLSMDVALHSERKRDGLVLLSGSYIAEREWKPRMPRRKGTTSLIVTATRPAASNCRSTPARTSPGRSSNTSDVTAACPFADARTCMR
jgi:phospholipase/carboxylesterase